MATAKSPMFPPGETPVITQTVPFVTTHRRSSDMEKISLAEELEQVTEHWSPRVIATLNGQHVKVVKLLGEFEWHKHAREDELFWVISGELEMNFRDRSVTLGAGEMIVVPAGVEHKPVARQEVEIGLFEPIEIVRTGD